MEMPIYIFYHMYCVNDCFDRFKKSYDKIKNVGLLNECDKFYVVLVGPYKKDILNLLKDFDKLTILVGDNDSSEIETLNLIWEKSWTHNFYVLYNHSKGVTRGGENVDGWIEYLEHFCIDKYKICLNKLNEGNTCGVELRTTPVLHYCGNIWWANSKYIKNIKSPSDFLSFELKNCDISNLDLFKKQELKRWYCEFWITHAETNFHITLNQSYLDFNFYLHTFPTQYYKINPKPWSYDILNVASAWRGLETYIPEIIKIFNIKQNLALEFGVDYGYSTHIFSNLFKKVIGVDTFQGDICIGHSQGDDFYYSTNQQFKDSNVDLYRLNYQNFIKNNNDRYDLIHIDIVHTYPETYECAEWSIKHSDVVLLHDTCSFPEIHKVCRDLSLKYKWGFINIEPFNGLGILYKQY